MHHMLISCVYNPPKESLNDLLKFLKLLVCDPVIISKEKWILGDLDIGYMKRNLPCLTPVKELLKQNGLSQLMCEYTRISNNGRLCVDWIIIDCVFVEKCGILYDLLSDHYPVFCIRKKKRESLVKEWKYIRQNQIFDSIHFSNLLLNSDWTEYDALIDVNALWDLFLVKITNIFCNVSI